MKIAIQAADLDAERIDGTRVYILNLLKYFGTLDQSDVFFIYHKQHFNPELQPPTFSNYQIKKITFPFFWTQIRFCLAINQDKPDILWMPMHNIPVFKSKKIKAVVTIHDLAFKHFPEMFTKKELVKLNFLTGMAIKKSDGIITVSKSSKKDILKFYPQIAEDKIKVIYHGFDSLVFNQTRDLKAEQKIKEEFKIRGDYILYVGAIQPRKNLEVLIEAFQKLKSVEKYKNLKLVLAGEKAWLWENIFKKINKSPCKKDILTPGKVNFENVGHLMRGASVFVFPSLYEGFGIPILEAMASHIPVICAHNSSLPEVAGEASLFFQGDSSSDLSAKIKTILENENLRKRLVEKGQEQIKKFSWEKCAQETLDYLKSLKNNS